MRGRHDAVRNEWQWPALDLVRLAIPRRVYTQSHIDYVVEGIVELFARRHDIRGMRFVYRPQALPHVTAVLAPVEAGATAPLEVATAAAAPG